MGDKSTDKVLIDWRLGYIWQHDIKHNYTQHNDTLQTDTQHYSSVVVLSLIYAECLCMLNVVNNSCILSEIMLSTYIQLLK